MAVSSTSTVKDSDARTAATHNTNGKRPHVQKPCVLHYKLEPGIINNATADFLISYSVHAPKHMHNLYTDFAVLSQ